MNLLDNIQAIIFDFDNTLYNGKGIEKNLLLYTPLDLRRMLADRAARKVLKGQYKGSFEAFFDAYAKEISKRTTLSVQQAKDWNRKSYMPRMIQVVQKKYTARPRLVELFKALEAKGIKLAVFSDYGFVPERLEALGVNMDELSEALKRNIYSAEDLGGLKPAPGPFLKIASNLGVLPEHILVIGDRNDTDGAGARATGMKFILLKSHKTKELPAGFSDLYMGWEEITGELL